MPDRPTFYADRCLGKVAVLALRAAGADVRMHDEYFSQDADDEFWISQVSADGWVILTKDKRIRSRRNEREAAILSQAKIITLSSGNMTAATMTELLVSRLAEMESLAMTQPAPFIAVLSPVDLQLVYPKTQVDSPTIEEP